MTPPVLSELAVLLVVLALVFLLVRVYRRPPNSR